MNPAYLPGKEWRVAAPGHVDDADRPDIERAGFTLIELLVVIGLTVVVSASVVPMMANKMANARIAGDARGLAAAMTLAKAHASSSLSQTRLYLDLDQRAYRIERLTTGPAPGWAPESALIDLSTGVTPGFDRLTTPPPNTQRTIAQAQACLTASGVPIVSTACVVFDSRGVAVDGGGETDAAQAVYVTDGTVVYAAALDTHGSPQLWSSVAGTGSWVRQ
jgi:prepilin-type N-terminal cleavage/methylation domain-containing protein